MAYYLTAGNNSSSEYGFMTPIVIASSTPFEIRMTYQKTAGEIGRAFGKSASFNSRFLINTDNDSITITDDSGTSYSGATLSGSGVDSSDFVDYVITRDGANLLTVKADTVVVGTSAGFTGSFSINRLFTQNTATQSRGASALKRFEIDIDGVATHDYNPTSSGGTGTTLPDDISSNDISLSGYSGTTDSWWVSYSDGPAGTISITSVQDYAFRKRDGSNQAVFTIAGDITDRPSGEFVEYRLDTGSWATLDASTTGATFTGSVTVTNIQDVSVRMNTTTTITDTVSSLGARVVILAWWQSNESGNLTALQTYSPTSGRPEAAMLRNGTFSLLADPVGLGSSGSLWPAIAELYSEADIPVGIINVAIGATSILRWEPSAADLYPSITAASALTGGFTFTTSIGGETDSGTSANTSIIVKNALNATIDQIKTDFGCDHYLTYFPRTTGARDGIIHGVFDAVIEQNNNCEFGGDLRLIDMTDSVDGTHLSTVAQADEAADLRYAAFTGAASILNLAITGSLPDATYSLEIRDRSTTPTTFIELRDVAFLSGAASVTSLNVTPATKVMAWIDDGGDPEIDGALIYGTTV